MTWLVKKFMQYCSYQCSLLPETAWKPKNSSKLPAVTIQHIQALIPSQLTLKALRKQRQALIVEFNYTKMIKRPQREYFIKTT